MMQFMQAGMGSWAGLPAWALGGDHYSCHAWRLGGNFKARLASEVATAPPVHLVTSGSR